MTLTAAVLVRAALVLATAFPGIEGTWTISEARGDRVQLSLQYEQSNVGQPIPRADLRGLTEAQFSAATSTPVEFRIEREAGTLAMEGVFREGRGSGHFRFTPDRRFVETLRALGVEGAEAATDRDLLVLAVLDVSSATVRELSSLFRPLAIRPLLELTIHGVTPEYVREMRSTTLADDRDGPRDLVAMRIHGITLAYVQELEALGYRRLSRRQLLEMRIHGVRAEGIRELRELGYEDLTPRQLVEMRIHRVTPAFIRELREVGLADLTPETLVRMRIHGVDAGFVRGARRDGSA